MASSSGYGPSTSGNRRAMRSPYLDLRTIVVYDASNEKEVEVRKLLTAVFDLKLGAARRSAEKLKAMGTSLDAAVAAVADPKSNRDGPLHVAAGTKYRKMCKMLVKEYNCDPNAVTADGETPLYFAVLGVGSLDVVEYLISSGADPNKATNRGITPLHLTAPEGHCEIAEYLLSKGANVDPICENGESPLHYAARCGNVRMVELLLKHGADCNRLSDKLQTPLVASLVGSSLECLKAFIKEGANINTGSRVTPLSVAARNGLADCINCLLENGADPNEPDEDGKLPVEVAASMGWVVSVDILLAVTNPLEKFASLNMAQIVEQEAKACQREALTAVADGDVAYWEKKYADAMRCYNKAFRLGHVDPSLYAKRSLCYLKNYDQRRFLDDAFSYFNIMYPDSSVPCTEKAAKKLVLGYDMNWRKLRLSGSNPTDETDQASREEHHP